MTPRFFVDPSAIRRDARGFVAEIADEEAHHALRVLRIAAGDEVVLLDDSGLEYWGRVREIQPGGGRQPRIAVEGSTVMAAAGEPKVQLTLVQALPKGDKMDLIVQKGTETGVSQFVPVISERVVVDYTEEKAQKRRERWQKIAHEAAKQAGRGRRPRIAPVDSLLGAVSEQARVGAVLIPWEKSSSPIKRVLREIAQRGESKSLTLVIGPEGGFSETEAREMAALGGRLVSLGARILRTETAGPVAAALTLYEIEMPG